MFVVDILFIVYIILGLWEEYFLSFNGVKSCDFEVVEVGLVRVILGMMVIVDIIWYVIKDVIVMIFW